MEQALTSDARPIPEHVVDGLIRFDHAGLLTEEDGHEMIRRIRAICCARAGEPKKLVVLKGFGHYEVYGGDAFRQVMEETLAWYGTHLPAR